MPEWLLTEPRDLVVAVPTTAAMFLVVLGATRAVGLRSLARLSSFDVAATVAIGTLLATTAISDDVPLLVGVVGVAVVYGMQFTLAVVRRRIGGTLIDNDPKLLMADGEMLEDALAEVRVDRREVLEQLRLAGVIDPRAEVVAVVMESTGGLSVLRRREGVEFDPAVLEGVRGRERVLGDRGR